MFQRVSVKYDVFVIVYDAQILTLLHIITYCYILLSKINSHSPLLLK